MQDPASQPDLGQLTDALLAAARRAGAEAADAMAIAGTALSIDVRAGVLEQAERSEGIEIGLRVLIGRRQACVSASDTREETLAAMAERAVAMAREALEDPHLRLAEPGELSARRDAEGLELDDPAAEPLASVLQEDARRAEAAALAVAGVAQVQGASAGWGRRVVHLAATNGFSGGYARSSRETSCVAISGEGTMMERDWHSESRVFQADLPDAQVIGRLAGERAVARVGARAARTGAFPVLYDERVSAGLIRHLLAAINGDAVARGSSWLRDAMGAQVLPAAMSLTEDPLRRRIGGARPFDAEGLATRPRVFVREGVLESWVLDLSSASRLGLKSTANAVRGLAGPPSPSVSNVNLTPGVDSPEALRAQMGAGLWVTSLLGATINPTTGDYSRGASGFWVENGQIVWPVNACTIAGNLRDMLMRVIASNDARPYLSDQVPSLLVEGLTVAAG